MISKLDVLRVTEKAFDQLFLSGGEHDPAECEATRRDSEIIKKIVMGVVRDAPVAIVRREAIHLKIL